MLDVKGELNEVKGNETCSEHDWKELFRQVAWTEFRDTLIARLAMTRDELEQLEGNEVLRAQGDARTLRFVLALEEGIMAEFASQKKADDLKGDD